MDDLTRAFIDGLIQSNFADLKGSSADLHLNVSERILNDLLARALQSQRKEHPWLALVESARAEGSVRIDVKLGVP